MKKKKEHIFIIVMVVIVGMITGLIKTKVVGQGTGNNVIASSDKDLGIHTEITEVSTSILREEISYIGTLEGKSTVMVIPKIASEIKKLNFKEGDLVKKGDILAILDDGQFNAKLNTTLQKIETMELNLAYLSGEVKNYYNNNPTVKKIVTAEKNYDYLLGEVKKYKILYENGAIPEETYNKVKHEKEILESQLEELDATSESTYNKLVHEKNMAEMQLKELYAMVEELRVNLDDTVMKSPMDGRIRLLHYSVGDLAMMGKPLATIDDIGDYIIKVNMGELDLAKISIDTKVMVKTKEGGEPIEAMVTNISPSVNPVTRVGEVEIALEFPVEEKDIIGSSIPVKFIVKEIEEGIVIENGFIKKLEDREVVYVFKDGYVYEKEIKTGEVVGSKTQILEGLEKGEKIAYKNLNTLYDGAKVYVFEGVDNK